MNTTAFLLFQLYGPIASWGESAVGEVRHTASWPTRSALIGLLGAALGLDRDAPDQARLQSDYRFAVKILTEGTAMRDYQTVQTSEPRRGRAHRNRHQQLGAGQTLSTLLTYRDYRNDARAIIAVQAAPDARWGVDELASALIRPTFTPYLGRKSCALALPMKPEIAHKSTIEAALDGYPADWLPDCRWIDRRRSKRTVGYAWEPGMPTAMTATFTHNRPDQPLSRSRWQFMPRCESVRLVSTS